MSTGRTIQTVDARAQFYIRHSSRPGAFARAGVE